MAPLVGWLLVPDLLSGKMGFDGEEVRRLLLVLFFCSSFYGSNHVLCCFQQKLRFSKREREKKDVNLLDKHII